MSNYFELRYCDKCLQMTNHSCIDEGDHYDYACLKCDEEPLESNPLKDIPGLSETLNDYILQKATRRTTHKRIESIIEAELKAQREEIADKFTKFFKNHLEEVDKMLEKLEIITKN